MPRPISAKRSSASSPSRIVAKSKTPYRRRAAPTRGPERSRASPIAAALERAGVAHEHVVVDGMPHGFAQMEFFPQARQTIDRMVEFLRKHLRVE